ncbi:hypothetical protein LCGC14_3162470 [marine sediment metagenome]|uniref:HNH nuclease domain-containing protein n=1 Tax=marine sediment metagenome TaxID=412755 RepID=A0A0F8WF04_9ZZZZ
MICTKCRKDKDIEEFNWKNKSMGYKCSWCKSCMAKYMKQWQKENSKKCNEYTKKWQKENPDQLKEYKKQYYQKNLEKSKEYSRQHRQDNKEYYKQYRQDNENHLKEYSRWWYKTNKDKSSTKSAKRRALKLNQTPIDANMSEISRIYTICAYMNSISVNCKWHVDHIHPLSKSGSHHQDNLQILDSIANMKKSNKL